MNFKNILKEIISTLVTFAIVFLTVMGLHRWVIQPFVVEGRSMDYTLQDGERLFMYKLAKVDRFDVIVMNSPNRDKLYIKRVIGMPGDSIEVKNDQLLINGQAMDEPYLADKQAEFTGNFTSDFKLSDITGQATIPEGHVFVMGDNRQNSHDGRSFGLTPLEDIVGQANLIFWPMDKIGLLNQYELSADGSQIVEK